MNIIDKEALLAEIQTFKDEALKMHLVQNLIDYCPDTDVFEHDISPDGRVYWMKAQISQVWEFWQSAKASVVPEGFKITKKPKPQIGNPNVDFSQAPDWVKYWLKDGHSNKCTWCDLRPKLDTDLGAFVFSSKAQFMDAPDFGFEGNWKDSITSRKAMNAQAVT